MKNAFNLPLFRFELEQLFATRRGLGQIALVQVILWAASARSSAGLYAGAADYWSNYILINGFCQSLVLNLLVAGDLFLKPKSSRTIEMLLASGVSPRAIAGTSVAVCAVYNTFSLLLAFGILAHFTAKPSFAPVHLLSFLVVIAANLATLVGTSFLALQTRYGAHLSGLFMMVSVSASLASAATGFSLNTSPFFQAGLLVLMAALSGVSLLLFRGFDREKVLLS